MNFPLKSNSNCKKEIYEVVSKVDLYNNCKYKSYQLPLKLNNGIKRFEINGSEIFKINNKESIIEQKL